MKKISHDAKKSVLAIKGGKPTMSAFLPLVHTAENEEAAAAARVIKKGPLSGFAGKWDKRFFGGQEVLTLEAEFAKKFKVKHSISCNSATSGLHMAIVALGIGPGDEVIVPPYTMSASATAVLMNGAVPIFADIDERTFCIDPKSTEKRITKRTKAIMVVNLFGQAADFNKLLRIAKKHKLKIIEDNAQGPGAKWNGKYTGTIGDIGVFSFNVHKTIQTGEGGMVVTDNDKYALRAQLCRNHGEAVVDEMSNYHEGPIFGCNYRMTEIIAAIARIQLRKLNFLTQKRLALVSRLQKGLADIPGLTPHYVSPNALCVFYRYAIRIDADKLGLSRDKLVNAMRAEGFKMSKGYLKPLHLLPVFQQKKAFNNTHFPFNYGGVRPNYSRGICPVAERMFEKEFTLTDICQHPYTSKHVDLFLQALKKVIAHKDELR
ncbi:DegT/DnrJ/EryC1/StrS family aminotransferase [Candidatus Kaiserbacteria bacterium]|nr:DegT/DnrJ/EryC1/StrS family aminotransferase [Candidatus Kaiserbacteria bacterium]